MEALLLQGHLLWLPLCLMPDKGHGCYGEMQQDIKRQKVTESQSGAKQGEKTFFGATCLLRPLPTDQYLNSVELFVVSVCSLQPNVGHICLPVKQLPVPGAWGCRRAAPLVAEHHAGSFTQNKSSAIALPEFLDAWSFRS